MLALSVDRISVHYGPVPALTDTTVHLPTGVLCGLIGVNGSGKSTLFKAIMGMQPVLKGRVTILGSDVKNARSAGVLSYMPQSEEVDWTFPLSVGEVVSMGRYRRLGITRRLRAADRAAVEESLERVQLADLARRQIGELSGGQRKRVFMARALAQEAEIFLLDEPFAGVDRTSESMLIGVLQELRDRGKTVLVSSHNLQRLGSYADQAILLKNTVLMHAATAEVLRPENLVQAFGLGENDEHF